MNKKLKIGIAIGCILFLIALIVICIFLKNTTYTITFDSNGGNVVESQTLNRGDKAVKPIDPIRSGYRFIGWYLGEKQYYFDVEVKKDIKLVAKWEKKENIKTVTVSFDTDGGTKISDIEVEKGEKIL